MATASSGGSVVSSSVGQVLLAERIQNKSKTRPGETRRRGARAAAVACRRLRLLPVVCGVQVEITPCTDAEARRLLSREFETFGAPDQLSLDQGLGAPGVAWAAAQRSGALATQRQRYHGGQVLVVQTRGERRCTSASGARREGRTVVPRRAGQSHHALQARELSAAWTGQCERGQHSTARRCDRRQRLDAASAAEPVCASGVWLQSSSRDRGEIRIGRSGPCKRTGSPVPRPRRLVAGVA